LEEDNPLYAGAIELVRTEWVWQFRGQDVSPQGDLIDGTIVTLDKLWVNLLKEGMYDPLIMRVGLANKKFRLEAGNHRIQLFYKHGIPLVPLTVQVKEVCAPHLEDAMNDGSHNFDAGEKFLISKITKEYMRPSEVFKSLVY
jgi:hypothetical protein